MKTGLYKKYKNRILFDIFLLIYACLLFYLFYNQLLYPVTGIFESDTSVHVRFAVEDHYFHSLAAFIYLLLSVLPFSNVLIALTLTATSIISIIACAVLIKKLLGSEAIPDLVLYLFSAFANFVMGAYVAKANKQHYIGYQNANMWHNSTYIFMKLAAIFTVIAFIDIYKEYKEKITLKNWIAFSVLLAVTTGFKASFLTVFAPALAVMLLIDWCKGTKFKNVLWLGTTVFPSLIIMYIQSLVMAGDGASNGYVISPFTALSMRGDHPKVTLVLSVLFPAIVFLSHIKDFYKDKIYLGTLILTAFGFSEAFLFLETGERSLDSNFLWGYSIALFFLFIESMVILYRDVHNKLRIQKPLRKIFVFLEFFVLLHHVLSGVYYFVLLLSGVTYFV